MEKKWRNQIKQWILLARFFNKQNQEEQGLKILTSEKMLSRLRISLAQLKAINNSEKLKN